MTVSDLLLDVLAAHGVRHMFGIPGDAINDLTDALRRRNDIEFIQVRHEEAGAFAASAQAKLTGCLSACMGTAGPGGVHLLNGLYDAKLDHAPVVAITGQVATDFIGTSHFQEVNLERLFADVAVYDRTVTTERQLPNVFLEACHAAIAHRGVAHISIPTDVSGRRVSVESKEIVPAAVPGEISPTADACRNAARLIDGAEKIGILAGIGCAGARAELLAFAKKLGAPIIRTLRAKEVIDDDHELCIGGLGLLGGPPAVKAINQCDLLVMVGTDFPYPEFYPEKARVIQIDTVATQIGKRHPVDVGLVGHAASTLATLLETVEKKQDRTFLSRMQAEMQDWRDDQEKAETSGDRPIRPARVMRELSNVAPDGAVFVCDTGTANAWSARHLRVRDDQRYTLSGGLASMAYGLPGALGAQLAYPDRQVFAIVGDGGFSMLMGDFLTAVRYELPVVVLVLNNHKLGFITLEQEAKGLPDHDTDLTNPDFAAIAEACGGLGLRVDDPDQLAPALEDALESGKPTVIDVEIDSDELILPPNISARQALNFGLAKVREAFGS